MGLFMFKLRSLTGLMNHEREKFLRRFIFPKMLQKDHRWLSFHTDLEERDRVMHILAGIGHVTAMSASMFSTAAATAKSGRTEAKSPKK